MSVKSAAIGIVIPTIGHRPSLIREALRSLGADDEIFVVVATDSLDRDGVFVHEGLADMCLGDKPGLDLPGKIDRAFRALPESVLYINWLGDDDILNVEVTKCAAQVLAQNQKAALVFGDFSYIDERGRVLVVNRLGAAATSLFSWLPQRIGQPATLYRRSHYVQAGGLTSGYTHAFDFDLFLRLRQKGTFIHLDKQMASWRWHSNSLTVSKRGKSAAEASIARIRNSTGSFSLIPRLIIEPIIFAATLFIASIFDLFLRFQSSRINRQAFRR
jgi:hypothetical protein